MSYEYHFKIANRKKADECPGHKFTQKQSRMVGVMECENCGCEVQPDEHEWYLRGKKEWVKEAPVLLL